MTLPDSDIDNELIDSPMEAFGPPQKTPLEQTSERIGKTLDDIAAGRPNDQYPALDAVIRKNPHGYCSRPDHDCRNIREESRENSTRSRLINDIHPTLRERMYVVEHEIQDINSILGTQQEQLTLAATTEQLKDTTHIIDKRIEGIHTRLDRDQAKGRSAVLNYIWGVALTLSTILNVILIYNLTVE